MDLLETWEAYQQPATFQDGVDGYLSLQLPQHSLDNLDGKIETYAVDVAFVDENAVDNADEDFVRVVELGQEVKVEDWVGVEVAAVPDMENEQLVRWSLGVETSGVDWVEGVVRSYCDCCEDFGLV